MPTYRRDATAKSMKIPILLVDDRRANLVAFEAVLASPAYDLVSATSGEAALAELEQRDFAVVLVDLQMPTLSGIETTQRMTARARQLGRRSPIIVVTAGDADRGEVLEAYRSGAVDFMHKPILPEVLAAKVAIFAALYQANEIATQSLQRFLQERQQAEYAAQRFRLLVESVRDYAIFILDPTGVVSTWNAGAERIKGYRAAEIIGKHFSIFYPPEVAASGKCERELEIATTEGRFEEEGWRVRNDGTRSWAHVTSAAINDRESGALVGFAKVTRDLTERREAEEEARRFRLLVESVKDYAIFILDPTGHIATWNTGAERIKGYTATEIIGQHFSIFYPPEVATSGKCERELETAIRDGRYQEEGWRVRKDGTRFWANVTITALQAPAGGLVGFAKVTRDLTDRMQHEATLRALAEEKAALAEKSRIQEFQERFIAILGHDLRNPLSAIDMGVSILRQRLEETEETEAEDDTEIRVLDRMKASSRRMSRMIEQILDLTRTRLGGGLGLRPTVMNLARTIHATVEELRIAHPTRAIELQCPPSLLGTWDSDRLEQVFSNLIGNAVHYGRPDRPVQIVALDSGDDVIVSVHNDGTPIPQTLQGQLFNPFRRGERDSKAVGTAGIGLGLYISSEIVLAHGGTIELRSTAVEGTTFRVTLPRSALANVVTGASR